jgi:hypothetical protein
MVVKKCIKGLLFLCALSVPLAALAATRSEVINGATCIPYTTDPSLAVPYQHWLYAGGVTAYCHLTMPDDWPVTYLSYVLFNGTTGQGVLKARLCVHSGDFSVTCGYESTISAGGVPVNWVAAPSPMRPPRREHLCNSLSQPIQCRPSSS